MRIDNVKIENPFVQAPMAGWTDAPFRTIARRFHKGLLFTEMVSAEALCRGNRRTIEYCSIDERHHPVALQLVGHDADRLAEAARLAEGFRPEIIDINAGCPDRKMVQQGAGGALLKKPEKLAAMVQKVVKAVRTPVSVKLRLGWDKDDSVRIGKMLEGTGAAFLTVNGYLVSENYSGGGDRKALKRIVEELDMPVIANGGVRDEADAVAMLGFTGAAGVMMGRATRGRPDRPKTAHEMLKNGRFLAMDQETLKSTVREHVALECAMFGDRRGMSRMRKHLHWYLKSSGIGYERTAVDRIDSIRGLEDMLDSI